MTSLTALIADHFSGASRARFLGLQAASMGVAGTASMAVGGILADVGWRLPFLAYSLSFVVLPVVYLTVREPRNGGRCAEDPALTSGPAQCIARSVHASGGRGNAPEASAHVPVPFLVSAYLTMIAVQTAFFLTPVHLPSQMGAVMGARASQTGLALSLMSLG